MTDVTRVEEHAKLLRRTAAEFDLDPNFMAGVMLAESGGRVGAVSSYSVICSSSIYRLGEPSFPRSSLK